MGGMTHSIAYIKVDGMLLATMPNPKVDMGGKERASVVGGNSVLGYSEVIKPGMMECEIALSEGMSLAAMKDITGATVTYEADTGQTYVIRDAFVTKTLAVTAGEGGKIGLVFEGQPAEEML